MKTASFLLWTVMLLAAGCLAVSCNGKSSSPSAPVTVYYVPATATLTPTEIPTSTPTRGHPPTGTPTGTPTAGPSPLPTGTWQNILTLGKQGTTGANGNFVSPWGVAWGQSAGQTFIAVSDYSYGNVQVFNGSAAYLYNIPLPASAYPRGLAIDSNNELYVAELGLNQVEGYYLEAGSASYDYAWDAEGDLSSPTGVKIDASGNLVVASSGNGVVYNLSWDDGSIMNQTSGANAPEPFDVALDPSGNIYAASDGGNGVVIFNSQYNYVSSFTGSGWSNPLPDAQGVAVDASGNLYISDGLKNRVVYATAQGTYLGEIDGFDNPNDLALNSAGDLYVVNTGAYVVDEYNK